MVRGRVKVRVSVLTLAMFYFVVLKLTNRAAFSVLGKLTDKARKRVIIPLNLRT